MDRWILYVNIVLSFNQIFQTIYYYKAADI